MDGSEWGSHWTSPQWNTLAIESIRLLSELFSDFSCRLVFAQRTTEAQNHTKQVKPQKVTSNLFGHFFWKIFPTYSGHPVTPLQHPSTKLRSPSPPSPSARRLSRRNLWPWQLKSPASAVQRVLGGGDSDSKLLKLKRRWSDDEMMRYGNHLKLEFSALE